MTNYVEFTKEFNELCRKYNVFVKADEDGNGLYINTQLWEPWNYCLPDPKDAGERWVHLNEREYA